MNISQDSKILGLMTNCPGQVNCAFIVQLTVRDCHLGQVSKLSLGSLESLSGNDLTNNNFQPGTANM